MRTDEEFLGLAALRAADLETENDVLRGEIAHRDELLREARTEILRLEESREALTAAIRALVTNDA